MWVLQRNDGKFVSADYHRELMGDSYTDKLQYAKFFKHKPTALLECCPDNELVVSLEALIRNNVDGKMT